MMSPQCPLNVKVYETQTHVEPSVLWLRARQLCCLGGHAPVSGEIISILKKFKDRKTDDASLVAAMENEVATVIATIDTNLRQGDLGVEVDSVKGDLACRRVPLRVTRCRSGLDLISNPCLERCIEFGVDCIFCLTVRKHFARPHLDTCHFRSRAPLL